jgi:hypothetical protein
MSASPRSLTRRVLPRARAGFEVAVGSKALPGMDISFGGCKLLTSEAFAVGSTLDFAVCLNDECEAINVRGTVIAVHPHYGENAMRVSFNRLTGTQMQQMAVWMSKRPPHAIIR